MSGRRMKAGAARAGRPSKGDVGTDAQLAELAAWSRRAAGYLDTRANRFAPITETELRRRLFARGELNSRQRRMVRLAWLISGHVAVDAAGQLRDTRTVFGASDATELAQRASAAASVLAAALALTADAQRRVGALLGRVGAAQERWGRHSARLDSSARRLVRAARSREQRRLVVHWLAEARARDASGDWRNVPVDVVAAGVVADLEGAGVPAGSSLVSLHRSAKARLLEAGRLGVAPATARQKLSARWSATLAYYSELSAKEGRTIRARWKVLLAPLVRASMFVELVAPEGVEKGGRFTGSRGGTVFVDTVPPPFASQPRESATKKVR